MPAVPKDQGALPEPSALAKADAIHGDVQAHLMRLAMLRRQPLD
jgi:hypothetical protein